MRALKRYTAAGAQRAGSLVLPARSFLDASPFSMLPKDNLISRGRKVQAIRHEGWWRDAGKEDDLLDTNRTVLDEFAVWNVRVAWTKRRVHRSRRVDRGR